MYRYVSEVRNKKLDDKESTKLGIPRNRNRNLLRNIRKFSSSKCNCAENGLCSEFTVRELSAAINALSNTSPGDDEVHNQLLQHLPKIGKQSLLQLCNRVKNSGQYPVLWRKGAIIPILKAGKDPSQMGSYRPIQLTSCVGKLPLARRGETTEPETGWFSLLEKHRGPGYESDPDHRRRPQQQLKSPKTRGSEKEDLRLVYLTYIKSDISYAYNAWYPCVSKENREKLKVTQRDAARTITGCTKNTNSKLLINEAGLLPLYVDSDIAQATAYERCLRLSGDDPLREIAENPVRRRLKSLGTWRETGKSSAEDSGLEDLPRERLIPVPDIPPWMIPDTFSCRPSLTTSASKTEPPEAQKAAVEETMKYLAKPDIEIYTDGSAMDGTDYLGGGISIRYPNGEIESMSIAAGRHGSSFRAEAMALTTALRWLDEGKKCGNLLILIDSQALVRKLEGDAEKSISELENETWRLIYRVERRDNTRLHIQWIPGHCGVDGNEEADR
ncbi:reverse transcriptase [Elysia marginata]|uniref:Reverse transcriptase n=1 Tax=Elysia marginata TaxID=1093978 RepID=A0AAV4HK02_9GAST|nr:reverse transcriptase [Elysia marginata]